MLQSRTGLLALVIGLSALIVLALAALVWRVVGLAAGRAGFDEARLNLPAGCHILDVEAGDGRILLRVGEGAGCERVLIVDPASGRVLGTILP